MYDKILTNQSNMMTQLELHYFLTGLDSLLEPGF